VSGEGPAKVNETAEDLERLQALLDRSYEKAGWHLRRIHTSGRRLGAADLVARLGGMCLLVLATSGRDGRPFTSPVDGVFHRGRFYFGTDATSLRWRHLARSAYVSLTHLPSEDWAVVAHGRAEPVDTSKADPEGIRAALLEVYVPRYGPGWERFLESGPRYARVEAERMFAIDVTAGSSAYSKALS
jgi:nitroimidazol reductase NimA-like FMN-containing flavoprotein (pyridoxamine 5'-phosphate oxidase superfamily)